MGSLGSREKKFMLFQRILINFCIDFSKNVRFWVQPQKKEKKNLGKKKLPSQTKNKKNQKQTN